jgi:hypothetical protein
MVTAAKKALPTIEEDIDPVESLLRYYEAIPIPR